MQHPAKKRRVAENDPSEIAAVNIVEMVGSPVQGGNGFEFGMNMEMDYVGGFDGDYGGMGMSVPAIQLFIVSSSSIYLLEQDISTSPTPPPKQT